MKSSANKVIEPHTLDQTSWIYSFRVRDKLYLMQYRRLQYWIEWQAKKHGMVVKYVNASYSSVSCPKCGRKMKEKGETSHKNKRARGAYLPL